jgi:hypothetical protein
MYNNLIYGSGETVSKRSLLYRILQKMLWKFTIIWGIFCETPQWWRFKPCCASHYGSVETPSPPLWVVAYLEVGGGEWRYSSWPQGNKIYILIKKIWLFALNIFQITEQIKWTSNNGCGFVLGMAVVITRPEGQKLTTSLTVTISLFRGDIPDVLP